MASAPCTNRDFKRPFSSKGRVLLGWARELSSIRLLRIGISKAFFFGSEDTTEPVRCQTRAISVRKRGIIGLFTEPGAEFGDIVGSCVDPDQGRGPAQGAEPNGGGVRFRIRLLGIARKPGPGIGPARRPEDGMAGPESGWVSASGWRRRERQHTEGLAGQQAERGQRSEDDGRTSRDA